MEALVVSPASGHNPLLPMCESESRKPRSSGFQLAVQQEDISSGRSLLHFRWNYHSREPINLQLVSRRCSKKPRAQRPLELTHADYCLYAKLPTTVVLRPSILSKISPSTNGTLLLPFI